MNAVRMFIVSAFCHFVNHFLCRFHFLLIKIFFYGPIDAFRKMMYDIYVQYYSTMLRKEG